MPDLHPARAFALILTALLLVALPAAAVPAAAPADGPSVGSSTGDVVPGGLAALWESLVRVLADPFDAEGSDDPDGVDSLRLAPSSNQDSCADCGPSMDPAGAA